MTCTRYDERDDEYEMREILWPAQDIMQYRNQKTKKNEVEGGEVDVVVRKGRAVAPSFIYTVREMIRSKQCDISLSNISASSLCHNSRVR